MQEVESLLYWLCKTRLPLSNVCTDRDTLKETQGRLLAQVYRILMQVPEKNLPQNFQAWLLRQHLIVCIVLVADAYLMKFCLVYVYVCQMKSLSESKPIQTFGEKTYLKS